MTLLQKLLLGCLVGSSVAAWAAAGAESALTLSADIAPRSLTEALAAFGRQTGLQLIYVSGIAEAQHSKGARAGLAASAALTQLLEGTGLTFEFLNARTVRIYSAPTVVPTLSASSAPPAHSAERHSASHAFGLEEVVVTGTRGQEPLRKVPIDMAVWSQADLEASGVKGISEIASLTPSARFDMTPEVGSGAITYLSIRGVSDRNTSVTGLYLEDTPIPPAIGYTFLRSFPFTFDLDRVEILRGPQLQLFGEGNQGGAVRVIFNPPSLSTFSALADSELAVPARGEIGYEAGVALGGPVVRDVLGFRVSAWSRSDGGNVDRIDPFTGATVDHNANHVQSTSVRGALTIAPTEAVRISPSLTYTSYDLHDSPFFDAELSNVGAGQLRNGALVRQSYDDTFYVGALKVTASLGAVDLSAVSSYFHRTGAFVNDLTGAFDWGSPLGPGVPVDYSDAAAQQFVFRQQTFMQELRFTSADPNATLTWDAGAFYSGESARQPQHITAAQGLPGLVFPGPVDLANTAVTSQTRLATFGEVLVRMSRHLTVSAGVHTERTHFDAVTELAPIVSSAGHDSAVLPRFGLSYQANERELIYLTVAKGYGSGRSWAFILPCLDEPPAALATDTLWSYEVGAKSGLLDGRVQLDTGIFHMVWNNSGQGYPALATSPCNTSHLGTPGAAASNGFDLSARALVGTHVKVDLALAYTDAYYTQTLIEGGVVVVRQGEAVGTVPHVVSPWNVTASVEYTVALPLDVTVDLRAEDIFRSRNPGPFVNDNPGFYDPGDRPDPSTNLVNLRATLRRARYGVALFVNNAFDAQPTLLWKTAAPGIPPFLATTPRPRTFGLSVSWRY